MELMSIIGLVVGLVVGAGLGFLIFYLLIRSRKRSSEEEAKRIIEEAEKKAPRIICIKPGQNLKKRAKR